MRFTTLAALTDELIESRRESPGSSAATRARGRAESRRERAEWRAQYAQDLDEDENLGDRDSGPDDDSDARGGLGEVTDPDVDEAESGNEEVELA